MATLEEVRRAKKQCAAQMLARRDVVGVGIGRRLVKGEPGEERALRVYVRRKLPMQDLNEDEALPRVVLLAGKAPGAAPVEVPVDVIEVGAVEAVGKGQVRPLLMGYDTSRSVPARFDFGTMAGVVADQFGRRYLLSCNHVLADLDIGAPGDEIVQPQNGGRIGALARRVPVHTAISNRVDAALAELDAGLDQGTVIDGIGHVVGVADPVPSVGTNVQLTGANGAGPRSGRLTDREADWIVDYKGLFAPFEKQILLDIPVEPGDSGALAVTDSGRVVGMVIAGGPAISVCSPIKTILDELGSAFVTGSAEYLTLQLV